MTRRTRTIRMALTSLAASAVLVGAGCGGGGGGGEQVASLGGDGSGEESSGDDRAAGAGDVRPPNAEFQDAMLEFAECMREHGIDMPDPGSGEGGFIEVRPGADAAAGGMDPTSEEFQAADEACRSILEDAAPDLQLDPEEQARMQDEMLELAQCMREQGFDMPDPQVDDSGRVAIAIGGGGGTSGAGAAGPDEDFQAAMEECNDELGLEFGPGARADDGDDGEDD